MGKTLAETIKEITKKHLEENNGMIIGQCLSAVGWVNNTVPAHKNLVELPMSDVAGAGIAAGAGIVGRRPILVVRFQDFMFLNSSMLVNFAAKRKEIFGEGCPVFIRGLATEGPGIGPVHSGVMHNIFMNAPGFKVVSPMTPNEYEEIWNDFMKDDDPMFVSEHRRSFNQTEEMKNIIEPDAEITLYGISTARFNILEAVEKLKKEGIKCNVINLYWLKPLKLTEEILNPLIKTKIGLVVDSGFEICGASQSIAYELMKKTKTYVEALGAEDRSVGADEKFMNNTPKTEKIVEAVKKLILKDSSRIATQQNLNAEKYTKNNMIKALIITGQGFQDQEVIYPYYRLLEENFIVDVAAKNKEMLFGIMGTKMEANKSFDEINVSDYDLLVLPGGVKALEKIRQEKKVLDFISEWDSKGKLIASTCHGAQLLISSKIVRGRNISGYYSIKDDIENAGAKYVDAPFVIDKNIISSPHYKHMGPWMKEAVKLYFQLNENVKNL